MTVGLAEHVIDNQITFLCFIFAYCTWYETKQHTYLHAFKDVILMMCQVNFTCSFSELLLLLLQNLLISLIQASSCQMRFSDYQMTVPTHIIRFVMLITSDNLHSYLHIYQSLALKRGWFRLSVTGPLFAWILPYISFLMVIFSPLPQPKLVLDLATPEGCKAELTYVLVTSQDSSPAQYSHLSLK